MVSRCLTLFRPRQLTEPGKLGAQDENNAPAPFGQQSDEKALRMAYNLLDLRQPD